MLSGDLFWILAYHHSIAQLVKNFDLQSMDHRIEPYCWRGFFWYALLASLSLEITSMDLDQYNKTWRSQSVDKIQAHIIFVKDPPLPSF